LSRISRVYYSTLLYSFPILSIRNQLRYMCKDLCAPILTLYKADLSPLEMEFGKRGTLVGPQLLQDCLPRVSHHLVRKCLIVSLIRHSSEPPLGSHCVVTLASHDLALAWHPVLRSELLTLSLSLFRRYIIHT
jgi:hypothetical protein